MRRFVSMPCTARLWIAASMLVAAGFVPSAFADGTLPLSFSNDILPVLNKYGCNAGGCHGKATGQAGFKLSVLGFDPEVDFETIVHADFGRRINVAQPPQSLLLLKATATVSHGGRQRFAVGSPPYNLLVKWIEEGYPLGKAEDPKVIKLEVTPLESITKRRTDQPLKVTATYSNGSTRDVTSDAEYKSQQPDIATVSAVGVVSTLDAAGEGTVMIRYLDEVAVARVTVPFSENLPDSAYAHFQPKNFIDQLVMDKWKKLGIAPSQRSTDGEFIRRAMIDLLGTLPSAADAGAFIADAAPDKRVQLIDRLLARNEYAAYWAHNWADILRVKRRDGNTKRNTFSFATWLRGAFQQNMPYNEFVTAIITAQGNVSDYPPVVWYREVRNQVHQVNDTAQLFLGLRISCANCHNHPYERFRQDDFWGFAAFFSRLGSKEGEVSNENAIYVRKEGATSNPRTGKQLKPKALGGPEYEYVRGEDPRQKLAEWLSQPDNPYFCRAMANRMWAHFMGVGLVEATDDMRVTNPPSNPQLLDALAKDFLDHKFDLKQLIRTIMTSEVYSLSSEPNPNNVADKRNYARYYARRMQAEVLSDALDTATGRPTKFNGFPAGQRAIDLPDEKVDSYFLDVFGRSMRETACECERSSAPNLAQSLQLMNSSELQDKLNSIQGDLKKAVDGGKPAEEVLKEIYRATYARDPRPEEVKDAVDFLAATEQKDQAWGDLVWAMLNAKEFLFNH